MAYSYLFGMGTIESRGPAAVLAKSPYMRRLQNVCYFSDLADILETSYEQHILGTSKIATKLARAIHRSYAQLTGKILLAIKENILNNNSNNDLKEYFDRLFYYYNSLVDEYSERLSRVAELASLMGMLAAPPYRRPFGTPVKRIYARILIDALYNEIIEPLIGENNNKEQVADSKEFTKKVAKLADNLAKMIKAIYDYDDVQFGVLKPLKSLRVPSLSLEIVENMKSRILGDVENFFRGEEGIFNKNIFVEDESPHIEEYNSAFMSIMRAANFLIKYRTLSNMLGLGYLLDYVLDSLLTAMEYSGLDNVDLKDYADALLLAGEAFLVNTTVSISFPLDIYVIYIKKKIGPCDDITGFLTINYQGARHFIPRLDKHNYIILKKLGVYNGEDYIASLREADEIAICSEPSDHPFEDEKCKIIKREEKEKFILDKILNPAEPIHFQNSYCCVLRIDEGPPKIPRPRVLPNEFYPALIRKLLALGDAGKPSNSINGDWSLFVTHDWVNLIASDTIPSAFQLDLLQKLSKDTNAGLNLDYDTIDDIALHIDSYRYLAKNLLNTIYTHILTDHSTILTRLSLILEASKTMEDCGSLTKIDFLAYLYFKLLAREFDELSRQIHYRTLMLNESGLCEENKSNDRKAARVCNYLKYIVNLARRTSEALASYSRLLDKLTEEHIKEHGKSGDAVKCLQMYVDSLAFRSLIDHKVKDLLGLYELRAGEGKREGDYTLVIAVDPFLNLAANSTLSDYLAETINLMQWEITKIQLIDTDKLNKFINYLLRIKYGGKLRCNGECVKVYITVPIQGVLKPLAHTLNRPTIFPLIINAITPEIISTIASTSQSKTQQAKSAGLDGYSKLLVEIYEEYYHELKKKISTPGLVRLRDFEKIYPEVDIPGDVRRRITPNPILGELFTFSLAGPSAFKSRRAEKILGSGAKLDNYVYLSATPIILVYNILVSNQAISKGIIGEWSTTRLHREISKVISQLVFSTIKPYKTNPFQPTRGTPSN